MIFNKGETLKEYGTIFFSNISLFQFEEGYDSISILAFSILKILPFAFLTLSFFSFEGIEVLLFFYSFSLKNPASSVYKPQVYGSFSSKTPLLTRLSDSTCLCFVADAKHVKDYM